MHLEKIKEKLETGEKLTIVAFGDSLTQGWMVRKGYVDFLQEMLVRRYPAARFTMVNRGIPGNTSEDGLYRLRHDVLDLNPHLVLVQFALNDAYMGVRAQRFKNNLETIVDQISLDTDAEIILVTSVFIHNEEENRMAELFYGMIEEIGAAKNIPLARVHQYWKECVASGVSHASLVQSDMVHPTVEGYRLMAEAVMKLF